jgi:signal transduction histidine kinase/CheY-like chemotaxis protein
VRPVGLALWDNELRFMRINRALAEMTDMPPANIVGCRLDQLPHADPSITAMLEEVAATGAPVLDVEVRGMDTHAPLPGRLWRASAFPIVVASERVGIGAVCQEITEQKAAVREKEQLLEAERAARADAERANKLKDDLLASVSHELRTPLAAIMSAGQVLQVVLTDGMPRTAADIIVRNARAQSRLVEDLLDVARIAAGQLEVKLAPVLPERLLQRAIETAHATAAPRQIAIEQTATCGDALVLGDEDRLVQILDNLLGNAIKFSPDGSTIRVECQNEGNDSLRFTVIDEGEGIDPHQMAHLFEPFKQASRDAGRRRAGLGLGLAICRRLAMMHGGTVEGESAGPGQGARFSLFLPLHRQKVDGQAHAPDRAPRLRLDGVGILLVDDELDLLAMQAAALRSAGANVIEASSATAALEQLAARAVDVLVSDLRMPQIDGLALIERWRAQERGRSAGRLPAIALTGYARVEDARRARAAGFDVHLAKPVDSAELLDAIVTLITAHSRRT